MKKASYLRIQLDSYERMVLRAVLETHNWNRKQSAKYLGISYRTLLYKIEKFQLAPPNRYLPASSDSSKLNSHAPTS